MKSKTNMNINIGQRKFEYVVIEGMDGSGKSTVSEKVKEWYEKNGKEVRMIHQPEGLIRRIVKEWKISMNVKEVLFEMDNMLLGMKLGWWRLSGWDGVVVSDRCGQVSGRVYKKARGIDIEWVKKMEERMCGELKADKVVVLVIDEKVSEERVMDRGEKDEIEKIMAMNKVAYEYKKFTWEGVDVEHVDAGMGRENVLRAVIEILNEEEK